MARCLSVSWHMCILWIFIFQESRRGYIFIWGNVEHLAISLKLYELDPSTLFISVVVMHEMGVFINSNRSVGSGGLFMHVSLTDIIGLEPFRANGWRQVVNSMPPAMAREMERMDHDRKLELIASGLGGSYVREWDGIYFHIVSFVHYMYMHRKEKYDWLETRQIGQ